MARYAVLLRGVNLGGKRKIAMAELRELLTEAGYTEVRTLLNSGNVVLTSRQSAARVESGVAEAIAATYGMAVPCVVRTGAELRAVIAADPFPELADNGSKYLAHFLSAAPDPALLAEHDPVEVDPACIRLGDRVIYQWCPDGVLAAPPVGGLAQRQWKVLVTARNWNTVRKLAALLTD